MISRWRSSLGGGGGGGGGESGSNRGTVENLHQLLMNEFQQENPNVVVNDVRTTMIVIDFNTKISLLSFLQKLGLIFACTRIYPIVPTFKLLQYTVYFGSMISHVGFFMIYVCWYTFAVSYPVHFSIIPYLVMMCNCYNWIQGTMKRLITSTTTRLWW